MSERVPEGWGGMTLGDLGSTFSGLSGKSSKDFGEGAEFLNYMQVFKNTLSNKEQAGFVKISEGEKQTQVKFGDIIFTTSSETPEEIGMTSVFLEQDWFPYLNSFCFGIRPYDFNDLSPEFANYLFRGEKFRSSIKPLAQGSTRYNLSKENLKKLKIDFPPLPEQKKIASILTSVDEVIENTQKQIDKLQDLKKATMNELLTEGIGHTEFKDSELGRIPKSWEVHKLGKIAIVQTGIAKNSKKIEDFLTVSYLRVANVQDGYLDLSEIKKIEIPRSKMQRYILQKGDVLMNEGGDFDKLGRGTVWQDEIKPCVHQNHVFVVRPDKSKLHPFFLKFFAGSEYGKRYFINNSKQSTNLASINSTQIKDMPIPTPSVDEQQHIIENLQSIESNIFIFEKKLSQTQSLKKSLMQDLLTGKVRVQVN